MEEIKDLIIIGGGPAGLSAGMYAKRAALDAVLLETGMPGGQATTTEVIENYPGFPTGISGTELGMALDAQARRFGLPIVYGMAQKITQEGNLFAVETESEKALAKTVIVASGAHPQELGVPGEKDFRGKGVSYCATCDGAFFRDMTVAVVGGGDAAVEEALFLTKIVQKVYLIHRRDQLRATKLLQERVFNNPKVEMVWNSVVSGILGDSKVEAVMTENTMSKDKRSIAVDGVFIYIGMTPNTGFVKELAHLDGRGYIITDEKMQANVPGLFAAGDVRKKDLRQVVTAVADGAIAAVMAERYIEGL